MSTTTIRVMLNGHSEARPLNRRPSRSCIAALVVSLVAAFCATTVHALIPVAQRQVLLDLYTGTNGGGWIDHTNWNGAAGSECTWFGVTCDGAQTTVQRIDLDFNNLVGPLPGNLNSLTGLQHFSAGNNELSGSLPSLAGMTSLQKVYLDFNFLTGSIPTLSSLTNLQQFVVSFNLLTGTVPVLTGLTDLNLIDVAINQLTGTIPSLAGLANLATFDVQDNQLTGAVPSLAGLTNIQYFNVARNQLTGSVPSLAGHASLRTIDVQQNLLTGSIPALGGLTNLFYFNVASNQLTGTIPALTGLVNLAQFNVASNQLTGSIPSLAGLTSLNFFGCGGNQLTGNIPSLTGRVNLTGFFVSGNQLTGSLPSFAGLTQLWSFEAADNQLTGSIPALTGLTSLQYFDVSNNQLSGAIPAILDTPASFTGLTFNVSHNQLTGTIPSLTGLTRLEDLNFSFNQLTGSVPTLPNTPDAFTDFVFDASHNQLTGAIPSLAAASRLTAFNVSFNQLTGNAPIVPAPNILAAGGSALCPNALNLTANLAWDAATGQIPWYTYCGTPPTVPLVTTHPATSPIATGVTLHGLVTSNGASTAVTFQYGLTTNYGSTATATQSPLTPAASNVAVSVTLEGLTCNTTYHFRAIGANFAGTTFGADSPFTTAPCGAPNQLLSVVVIGSGTGTATSDSPGIACGNDCSESYPHSTDVILLVTPDAGSVFTGWSGECTGASQCDLPMTAPRSVTATVNFRNAGSPNSSLYVQKSYVAYYGRPAEPDGLAYWATRMDNEGGSLGSIINAFGNSDEFNRRYGGLGNAALVTLIYQQTLGRAPDQAGLDYYIGELDAGRKTLQTITLDVQNGATGLDAVTVANRLDVANHYTGKVAQGCPYDGELTGVASLVPVSSVASTVWPAKVLIEKRCKP